MSIKRLGGIKAKLLLAPALILLFFLITGIYSAKSMLAQRDAVNGLFKGPVNAEKNALLIERDLLSIHASVYRYFSKLQLHGPSGSEEEYKAVIDKMSTLTLSQVDL